MSFDSPAENAAFKSADKFQYPLWSDLQRELALYYGAAKSKTQGAAYRVTVILDPQGHWVLTYPNVDLSLLTHCADVLKDMKAILGK